MAEKFGLVGSTLVYIGNTRYDIDNDHTLLLTYSGAHGWDLWQRRTSGLALLGGEKAARAKRAILFNPAGRLYRRTPAHRRDSDVPSAGRKIFVKHDKRLYMP